MLNNFCFHVYAQKSHSLSHSFNLSFTHSRHAEQLLFSSLCSKVTVYCRKLLCFFGTSSSIPTDSHVVATTTLVSIRRANCVCCSSCRPREGSGRAKQCRMDPETECACAKRSKQFWYPSDMVLLFLIPREGSRKSSTHNLRVGWRLRLW